jgi:hypothetical protein
MERKPAALYHKQLMSKLKNLFSIGNLLGLLLITYVPASGQPAFAAMPQLFSRPQHYVVAYTTHAPKIDGKLNDPAWQQAAWTNSFQDIEGSVKPAPPFNTQVKMLWNDSCLFIAARLQEPHLWAKVKQHDEIVFHDNDFEVFIDPDNDTRQYFEIEVNALNTIFDLFMSKPYRSNGGPLFSWDTPGMQSAVQMQGTLNNSKDKDTSWTVELKIPFSAVNLTNEVHPPKQGDLWRINFSRVEWDTQIKSGEYGKIKDAQGRPLPEHNWVWSPQGVINMHYPERWGYLEFSKKQDAATEPFHLPYADLQKQYLWLVYYQQQKYRQQHHSYAIDLNALGIKENEYLIDKKRNTITLQGNRYQFSAGIADDSGNWWYINNDGLIQPYK